MSAETIAIMAPGQMGHAIGGHLVSQGLRVIPNLEGRGPDTQARAARAGIIDVGSDSTLVDQAEMVLSVLPRRRRKLPESSQVPGFNASTRRSAAGRRWTAGRSRASTPRDQAPSASRRSTAMASTSATSAARRAKHRG